ncbi:MAG: ZIP family metal transporter [Candidatus Pacebacteria bacterium]|nr:ZIP family metal transporter [Candidatus Paceibacterota bacterium]
MLQIFLLLAIATFVATYLGGFFALRTTDKLHLVTGFSAGAVIGVAFFDLLPEAFEIMGLQNIHNTTTMVAFGFILYLIIDRMFILHAHNHGEHSSSDKHIHSSRGNVRAGSFSLHSLLDGIAIGLSFQVSISIGLVVALAVLAHDFSDGINTVSAIMKDGGTKKQAFKWLLIDAVAPVVGIFSTLFFTVKESTLGIILAIFCGFFFYIGASDLVPESYHAHPTKWTTIATILGVLFIYCAISLAG